MLMSFVSFVFPLINKYVINLVVINAHSVYSEGGQEFLKRTSIQ